ncbi:hypothetical protein DPMN_005469 [Dreissena polymorpha]|uniref:Uncharacterized protein n=1 Tax=Dreissena polymorpha TaxID=45954 RepID=A0A9D4MSA1_DREPO|nr:hypothetical protein DPMN_005469 [Dreissena polymorpha]
MIDEKTLVSLTIGVRVWCMEGYYGPNYDAFTVFMRDVRLRETAGLYRQTVISGGVWSTLGLILDTKS